MPIVPVTFLDNWYIFPDNKDEKFVVRPGLSRIVIHEPISTVGMTDDDVSELRNKVFNLIQATIIEEGKLSRKVGKCLFYKNSA